MKTENKIIVDAIKFLEDAPFKERKPYLKDFYGKGVELNGYKFQRETWCWLIWKPTDIDIQPEYKGEPLVKIVPNTVEINRIAEILNAQPWTYI